MEANNTTALPNEIQQLVKTYSIKDIFQEQAGTN
jgi:type III restriction enzyme